MEVDSCNHWGSIVSRIHGRIFMTFFLEMQMLTLTLFTVWRQDGPAPGQDVDPVLGSGTFLSYGTCDLSWQ